MTQWNGMLVRISLDDNGDMPRKVTSNSPDIECNGTNPMTSTELADFVSATGYAKQTANTVYLHNPNYFYVRAKNLSGAQMNGYFQLYWAPSSLILMPSLWSQNYMKSSANKTGIAFSAQPQEIVGTTSDAFYWNPGDPPSGTHYCLMGQASTSADPKVGIPTQNWADGAAMADWFNTNGNWGWKNTVDIPGTVADFSSTQGLTIPGEPSTWAHYHVYFECFDVNLQWNFQFTSATVIPTNPSYPNGSNTVAILSQKPVESNADIGASWWLPGGFSTQIQVNVWFNGAPPPSGSTKFRLRVNQVTDDTSLSIYKLGTPLSANVLRGFPTMAEDIPIGVEVKVGDVNFLFPGNEGYTTKESKGMNENLQAASVQKGVFSELGSKFTTKITSGASTVGANLNISGALSAGGVSSHAKDEYSEYPIMTLSASNDPSNDADILITGNYEQLVTIETIQLVVEFSPSFPAGVMFEVTSNGFAAFNMPKQPAAGKPSVSSPVTGPFFTNMGLLLWIPPGTDTSGASVTLKTIEITESDPIGRETPITKMQVNLP